MDRLRPTARTVLTALLAPTALPLLAALACNPFVRPYRRDAAVQLHADGATVAAQWNGTLAPPAGSAAATPLTGVVTATPSLEGGGTYVHVSLANAGTGGAYAWQLREGPCGGRGAMVGTAALYRALTVGDQGRAAASATVPVRLSPGARYHVRVSPSAADAESVAACADLTPPTR